MQQFNYLAFDALANSGTVTSSAIPAEFITSISAQAKFSDNAAAGSLKFQASNDSQTPTNWNDVPNTATAVTSGALTLVPNTLCCYQWIRLAFVSSGGAGTITARVKVLEAS